MSSYNSTLIASLQTTHTEESKIPSEDRVVDAASIAARYPNAKRSRQGWKIPCPAHRGDHPNCYIADGDHGLIAKCWSHDCDYKEIVTALDVQPAWKERHWTATYDNLDGKPRHTYRWTSTDGTKRIAGKGSPKGCLLLPWGDDDPDTDTLVIVEGEKAAKALQEFNFDGYTPVSWRGGCKTVGDQIYTYCQDRTVIIWPDNDEEGRKAGEIAGTMAFQAGAAAVKMLKVSDLPPQCDVADLNREQASSRLSLFTDWAPEKRLDGWTVDSSVVMESIAAIDGDDKKAIHKAALEKTGDIAMLDRADQEQAYLAFEEKGLSRDTINRSIKPSVSAKSRQRRDEKKRPAFWLNEEGHIMHGDDLVAPWSAHITAELVEETGQTTAYRIDGHSRRKGEYSVIVDWDVYADPPKLKAIMERAAYGSVHTQKIKWLPEAIKSITDDDNIDIIRRYTRTGWHDGRFVVSGRVPDGGLSCERNAVVDLEARLPYHLPDDLSLDRGLQALDHLLDSCGTHAGILIATMLAPPLSNLMRWQNSRTATMIVGETGSFKTTRAMLLMSIYGAEFCDSSRLLRWGDGATANAIRHLSSYAGDLPLLVDNYKPTTGGGPKAFVGLMHSMLEGGDKARMTSSATMRDHRRIDAWLFCTGEDVPDIDAATLARLLILRFRAPDEEAQKAVSRAQRAAHQLPAVGRAWIDWLEAQDAREMRETWDMRFDEARSWWLNKLRLQSSDMPNAHRVATSLAVNQITLHIAQQCPAIADIAKEHDSKGHTIALELCAQDMAAMTTEAVEAHAFLGALNELLASGEYQLLKGAVTYDSGQLRNVLGWRSDDDNTVYLLPQMALKAVSPLVGDRIHGMSSKKIYSQLADLGLLASTQSGRYIIKKRVGSKTVRVLHLRTL